MKPKFRINSVAITARNQHGLRPGFMQHNQFHETMRLEIHCTGTGDTTAITEEQIRGALIAIKIDGLPRPTAQQYEVQIKKLKQRIEVLEGGNENDR